MKKALLNIVNFAYADVAAWFTTLWSGFIAGASVVGGVLLALIQKYLVRDLAFLPWLIVIIFADTVAGYRLAKKKWRENPTQNPQPTGQVLKEKLAGKFTAVSIALVMLNVLTNFEISGIPAQLSFVDIHLLGTEFDFNVFKAIYFSGATYLIFIEAKSTVRNLKGLGYNIIPKGVTDLIDKVTGKENEGSDV